jgi:hypothetical protein
MKLWTAETKLTFGLKWTNFLSAQQLTDQRNGKGIRLLFLCENNSRIEARARDVHGTQPHMDWSFCRARHIPDPRAFLLKCSTNLIPIYFKNSSSPTSRSDVSM